MAKSFDKSMITENDELIRLALMTELSSIAASKRLACDTISKCKTEIEKMESTKSKSKLFSLKMVKFGAPLAAGALALVLVFTVPGMFDSNMSAESSPLDVGLLSTGNSAKVASPEFYAAPSSLPSQPLNGAGEPFNNASEPSENNDQSELGDFFTRSDDANDSGRLKIESMQQQTPNDFSVLLGNLFISLDHSGTDDFLSELLISVLGPANSESSDTSKGITIKTFEYDGLTAVVTGAETYSISSIEITNENYTTFRGITVGMSVENLSSNYDSISLDGYTDSNNCAYLFEENSHFIRFEVKEGLITSIKYYSENE